MMRSASALTRLSMAVTTSVTRICPVARLCRITTCRVPCYPKQAACFVSDKKHRAPAYDPWTELWLNFVQASTWATIPRTVRSNLVTIPCGAATLPVVYVYLHR